MTFGRPLRFIVLFAYLAGGGDALAETLFARDIFSQTNTDWMALARAQANLRAGQKVDLVWRTNSEASYSQIRRELWLAALHGIAEQTNSNEATCRLMAPEMDMVRSRLKTPFDINVAVRDTAGVQNLYSHLIQVQTTALLVGIDEPTALPTILRCQESSVLDEQAQIVFTSISLAATFSQSCHMDDGLVFESNGQVATNVFLRRFQDRTATVVNLANSLRRGLIYRSNLKRLTFDLPPAGVVHLNQTDLPRLTQSQDEPFASELWQVSFNGKSRPRIVPAADLPVIVPESYFGPILYRAIVFIPPGESTLFLHLDANGAETSVTLDGRDLGTHAWEPFDWMIPRGCHGRRVSLEIRIDKHRIDGFLQSTPAWHRL